MATKSDKPKVEQYSEFEWEFIYPASIESEKITDEFWEAVGHLDYNDSVAEKTFKKLIAKFPYFIDAYNHLSIAFRNQEKDFESLLTAEKSYNLGKSYFPKSFNWKTDKLIWPNLDNRPFLRACQIYGLECQSHKNYKEAIEIYNENLSLNEGDNQGIRYLLLECHFAMEDYKKVRQLLDQYTDDFSVEFKFGRVALNVLENNFEQADKNLKEAIGTNKYLIEEIIKERHFDASLFNINDAGIASGSIQEAFEYWKRNENLYRKKGIVDYFKSHSKSKI